MITQVQKNCSRCRCYIDKIKAESITLILAAVPFFTMATYADDLEADIAPRDRPETISIRMTGEAQRQEIVSQLKDIKLVTSINRSKDLCQAFVRDFARQQNIEYLKPLVTTHNSQL